VPPLSAVGKYTTEHLKITSCVHSGFFSGGDQQENRFLKSVKHSARESPTKSAGRICVAANCLIFWPVSFRNGDKGVAIASNCGRLSRHLFRVVDVSSKAVIIA